ncbi:hypothetical protein IWX46DRAFT_643128 [Phyllosticta citricarpa]|uniref:Uncharacterized protein n=1 Tax=Phyllosticta citricarpa TaxID=55181 RepID=A0ABR1LS58_9PEZI
MKGKLLVNVPPLPSTPVGSLGPPPPKPEPKRFGVDVHPDDTFQDVWPRIDANFRRLYPHEYPYFSIKKLQAFGCDVAYDEKVGDWFDEETDRSKKVVEVVRAPVDRNISVAPTSFLRPPNLLKRSHLAAIDENAKRRRIDEEQYGVALEDMLPDRPIRSREQDTEALQPGNRPRSIADSDVVVVADSQREAVPLGAPRDAASTKTESPDRTSLMDVPEAVPSSVTAEANGLHSNQDTGVFRKPGLPASASKDAAATQPVRRSATPKRRKKSVATPAFPPRPPWNPSPSPSSRSRRESPSEPALFPLPTSQQLEHCSEQAVNGRSLDTGQENDDGPDFVHDAHTPTPTQSDSLPQASASIPSGNEAQNSWEPSPIFGTPPSAQRPPRSPDGPQAQASATIPIPEDQAVKSLEKRRHRRTEPSSQAALSSPAKRSADKKAGAQIAKANVSRPSRSSKSLLALEGESFIETGSAIPKNEASQRTSIHGRTSTGGDASTDTLQTESNANALRDLKKLNGGKKIYGEGRLSKFSRLEDEALLLGRRAGLTYQEIVEKHLPNRSYRSLTGRYKRLIQERHESASQTSGASINRTSRTHSDQPESSQKDPTQRKDSHSSQRKRSSPPRPTYRKNSQTSQQPSQGKRLSPEVRIPPPSSQLARRAENLAVQPSSEPRSCREEETLSPAHSSQKPHSRKSQSAQDAKGQIEKLKQKYVDKQAEKAQAERRKEACLQRQIKAKKFRDFVEAGRKTERRRTEREAREKKEVARLRQREQEELREFRANLYACEQAGMSWEQSKQLLRPDQSVTTPIATGSDVRGKPKTYGSSKSPIHNHAPDSTREAPLSRLRPRRTSRSAPSVADGANERRQAADHSMQRDSLPSDTCDIRATMSSQVKDSSVHDREAAKPEATQITEPMELDVVSTTSRGVLNGGANHGQAFPADDSDSTSDNESITSPEPDAEPARVEASSTLRKRPAVRPLEFQSEELGHNPNPASYVPSSPSEASDTGDAPPSSPPVAHSPPDQDGLPSSEESSSSDSEGSSASDSEASSEVEEEHAHEADASKTYDDKTNGVESQPSTGRPREPGKIPRPPTQRPAEPVPRNRDPRYKNLSEIKAALAKEPKPAIAKPVVEAPPKKPELEVESSSDDDSSSSDSSTASDSSVERLKKAKRAERAKKHRNGFMKFINSLAS